MVDSKCKAQLREYEKRPLLTLAFHFDDPILI